MTKSIWIKSTTSWGDPATCKTLIHCIAHYYNQKYKQPAALHKLLLLILHSYCCCKSCCC
jgi:hypothetical protein